MSFHLNLHLREVQPYKGGPPDPAHTRPLIKVNVLAGRTSLNKVFVFVLGKARGLVELVLYICCCAHTLSAAVSAHLVKDVERVSLMLVRVVRAVTQVSS